MKKQLKDGWKKTKDFAYRNRYKIGIGFALAAGGVVAYEILKRSPKAGELLSTAESYDPNWEKSIFEKLGLHVEWPTDGGNVPLCTKETAVEFIDKIGDGNAWIQLDVFDLGKDGVQGVIWLTPKGGAESVIDEII